MSGFSLFKLSAAYQISVRIIAVNDIRLLKQIIVNLLGGKLHAEECIKVQRGFTMHLWLHSLFSDTLNTTTKTETENNMFMHNSL